MNFHIIFHKLYSVTQTAPYKTSEFVWKLFECRQSFKNQNRTVSDLQNRPSKFDSKNKNACAVVLITIVNIPQTNLLIIRITYNHEYTNFCYQVIEWRKLNGITVTVQQAALNRWFYQHFFHVFALSLPFISENKFRRLVPSRPRRTDGSSFLVDYFYWVPPAVPLWAPTK